MRTIVAVCSLLAAAIAVLAGTGALERPELATVDARFSLRGDQGPSKEVVVVGIDDSTDWPFPRSEHAQVIDALRTAGADTIVYDVEFTTRTQPREDRALVEAIGRASGRIVLAASATDHGRPATLGGGDILEQLGARAGSVLLKPDPGGVFRRVHLEREDLATIAVQVTGRHPDTDGDDGVWIDFRGPPGTIRTYPFFDVRDGRVPADAFRDKIVVVGPTDPVLQDVHPTSAGGGLMAGPEIQANAIDTFLRGAPLHDTPTWLDLVLVVALGLTPALLGRRWLLAVVVGGAYLLVAYAAFAFADLILPVVAPLLALGLSTLAAANFALLAATVERRVLRERFARFVDERVVDDVLARTDKDLRLGGTRLDATVVFGDLRNFTGFAEDLQAERVIEVLNRYHDAVSDPILRHGGALVSVMGDGVMAAFGAPVATPDHADRALRATREMITGMRGFNAWLREQGLGDGLGIGIGVHSGAVMSGNVGGRNRLEYTVIGDTTNVASRLEALTAESDLTVLISRETRDRLSPDALDELELVGEVRVRGRRASVEAWTLPASEVGIAGAQDHRAVEAEVADRDNS
jgi:adenylate cyclase